MLNPQLSPKEKRRLERYMQDIQWQLRQRGSLDWVARQKLRIALTLLGAERYGSKILQAEAQEILWDDQPFKERRLRKLVNG
jgi:hypothetical protein